MDPDVALEIIRNNCQVLVDHDDSNSSQETAEAFLALDEWIQSGGFLPKLWRQRRTLVSEYDVELTVTVENFETGTHIGRTKLEVLVDEYPTGRKEVALRPDPFHTWSPPVNLREA